MGPFESSHQHGPPLLGRVQAPCLFPGVNARMQPSDSLTPVGRGSGRPLPLAYLAAGASSVPLDAADSVCDPRTRCASETGHRLSA